MIKIEGLTLFYEHKHEELHKEMEWDINTYHDLKTQIESGDYLYIIYSEYGCKIGYSKTPLERMESIRLGLPSQKCFLIGLYSGPQSAKYEKRLHKKYKSKRLGGEWFILEEYELDEIFHYLTLFGFKCLIKISIYWANYLLPSVFFDGRVKLVEKTNRHTSDELSIPPLFKNSIMKPKDDFDTEAKFMTSSEISKHLYSLGLKCEPQLVGKYLKVLGFKPISKRLEKIGPRKGYYIKLNTSGL